MYYSDDDENYFIYPNCTICDEYRASNCKCGITLCFRCQKECKVCKENNIKNEQQLMEKNKISDRCVYCYSLKTSQCYHCKILCCDKCIGTTTIKTGMSCDLLYNLYCSDCLKHNPDITTP